MARMLLPVSLSSPMKAEMSIVSRKVDWEMMRLDVAVELKSGEAGAFRSAIFVPLRYATNPSLYLIRRNIEPTVEGSAVAKGKRTKAEELTLRIGAPMSVPMRLEKLLGAGGAVVVER